MQGRNGNNYGILSKAFSRVVLSPSSFFSSGHRLTCASVSSLRLCLHGASTRVTSPGHHLCFFLLVWCVGYAAFVLFVSFFCLSASALYACAKCCLRCTTEQERCWLFLLPAGKQARDARRMGRYAVQKSRISFPESTASTWLQESHRKFSSMQKKSTHAHKS